MMGFPMDEAKRALEVKYVGKALKSLKGWLWPHGRSLPPP
jgi:hypothetical protein